MDIEVKSSAAVQIGLSQETPQISIGKPQTIGIDLAVASVNLTPKASSGVAFNFVQRIMEGTSVVRCTLDEFQSLPSLDGSTWYAVTTTSDELRYLYLGPTLIAQANQDDGTWGFAYTFPMTFGR